MKINPDITHPLLNRAGKSKIERSRDDRVLSFAFWPFEFI
jgi:hypothetical protein